MTDDEQEYDRILADCTKSLDACPDDVVALLKRGRAWYEKRNYDKAIIDFDNVLSRNADGVDVPGVLNGRGLAFCDKGEYDLAITDFTEAILHGPTGKGLATLYFNRGRARHLKGTDTDAIDDFNEVIRLAPHYANAYGMRGLAWQNIGDYGRAIADYNLAIRNDPESADAYHNRGNTWVHLQRFSKGIADFTSAIRLDPNNAVTFTSRGVAWRRKGRYRKALADYERALAIEPESAKRRLVLGGFLACCPEHRYRDGPRALKLLTEACELTDYSAAYYLDALAAAHAEQGDSPSAIVCQQKALALTTADDEKEIMRGRLELYEGGKPRRLESPTWRERWS